MRTITGQSHRERILKSFSHGTRILEWGSGGSTLWFADRLPPGATLVSIDHDPAWHEQVKARIGKRDNVRLLLFPAIKPLGKNATIEEENADSVRDYIHAMDNETFDVIIIDGVARNACLRQAWQILSAEGVAFLHDAQRSWYDEGKSLFVEHGTIGSCPEYPGPLLWWGGLEWERSRYSIGSLPIAISFFTIGTPYEQEADHLKSSLAHLGMEAEIIGVPSQGSWEKNCAYKARFIHDTYFRTDRPVMWLDADAIVRGHPLLLAGAEPDFAIHKVSGWEFGSGTIYFNRTPMGQLLLETWLRHCEAMPEIWDQIHLDRAWEEVTASHPLYTMWLPQSYTKIFDAAWDAQKGKPDNQACEPIIEQFQASRRFKLAVSRSTAKLMRDPSDELKAARRACRPRVNCYDSRFVLNASSPLPDPWALAPREIDDKDSRGDNRSIFKKLQEKLFS